ncbi:hypothetical protein J7I88_30655 [Paraburkholderia strydomiana]|nr:hypothetical protein [Paraburkholderia strydomiana]
MHTAWNWPPSRERQSCKGALVEGQQPVIGDGDSMGVVAQAIGIANLHTDWLGYSIVCTKLQAPLKELFVMTGTACLLFC